MDRLTALALVLILCAQPAQAEVLQPYISEASERFKIPESWIKAVIKVESNGNRKAVSHKGAMGLMQLMPATWEELRSSYHLGPDPFNPHDNILAGTAYLKAMYDRFGYPGLFAAYNAGAARYQAHLRTGKPLPRETRTYVARLSKKLGFGWQQAAASPLFFVLSDSAEKASEARLFVPRSQR